VGAGSTGGGQATAAERSRPRAYGGCQRPG